MDNGDLFKMDLGGQFKVDGRGQRGLDFPIRGCRDKYQGNLFERDGTRKVSLAGEAPGDRTGECVPFVLPGFAFTLGHGACRSA